jgi:glycosyltransferase involved in cell wall biosynthesis
VRATELYPELSYARPSILSRERLEPEPRRDGGFGAPRPATHICFVAPHTWPVLSRDPSIEVIGGAEVQQSILARALAREGYRVSMICLDFGQPRRVEVDGVTVHSTYLPDAGLPLLRFFHPRLSTMWRTMREVDADVYYQRSSAMLTGVVAEFCRRHGKRSVYAAASDVDFIPGRQPIRYRRDRWLFERGLARVDRIVVQNAGQRENCRNHYARDSLLIPSCYELPERPPGTPAVGDADCVLWVGVLRELKRPELFLELARRLPQRRFVLIGGADAAGPDTHLHYERVREAARALPNVEMPGFLPLAEVEPWFDRARVYVNTSVYEGMPNTFLQAWSRGIPTVAFIDVGARLGGEPVYSTVQSVEQGAAEIERLFADGAARDGASARLRAYFEHHHSVDGVLARYARLLEELGAPLYGSRARRAGAPR